MSIQVSEYTITVSDWRGEDKQITRDEFVKQWVDHGLQFNRLDWDFYQSIKDSIKEAAEKEFDRLLAAKS